MADDDQDDEPRQIPANADRPRSRALVWWTGFKGWLAQWILWDERPTPAQYREAVRQRDAALAAARRLQVELNVAQAEADASKAEVEILAAVVERNRERVAAEAADAAAKREQHLNQAASHKGARGSGD